MNIENRQEQLQRSVSRMFLDAAAMNPAPNGRTRNVQLWEEVPVPGFANRLSNPVVVDPPRVRGSHPVSIGARDGMAHDAPRTQGMP
jgi:hypothetical protein